MACVPKYAPIWSEDALKYDLVDFPRRKEQITELKKKNSIYMTVNGVQKGSFFYEQLPQIQVQVLM